MTRTYTTELLLLVDEGMLDKDDVIMACVKYMSEDDVEDMMRCNDWSIGLEYHNREQEQNQGFDEVLDDPRHGQADPVKVVLILVIVGYLIGFII